ncbi:MAG: hypothetical protein HN644_09165 [Rhodospirillales bacterium]|nr:hypothetical protein [Rhodospirillales bacterium]MBT7145404.1 hypothetical protein [Rhodospirillales bacterium]MBT7506430.1 hypothetical protein [Rhodospirillales bacterium]
MGTLFVAAGVLVASAPVMTTPSQAQESLKIIAVVNDDIISAFDIHARTLLVIVLSKLPRNQQTVDRLAPQILRMLIDETLKLQEAERLGITVSQQEMDNALIMAGKQNKISTEKLIETLDQTGVGIESLLMQAKSEIAWSRIVPMKYGRNVEITDNDITKAMAKAANLRNQPQFLMSEILLSFDNPSKDATVRKQAQQLIQELKNGAKFDSLARAFSQSPSAPNGGALGWTRLDQMPDRIAQIVQTMRPGQISTEISLPSAYVIVHLRQVRASADDKVADTVVDLNQFHLELPGDASTATVESYMQTAKDKTQGARSCAAFNDAAKQAGSPLSGGLGKIALSKLPEHLSSLVQDLAINTPSKAIRTNDAVVVFMVCERIEPKAPSDEVEKARVQQQLFGQKLAVYARQAMRDLRRAAYIDIR